MGKLFTHPVCNSLPLLKSQTPVDGHLDCFYFLATINRLSVSIYQRALLPTDSSLRPFREALGYSLALIQTSLCRMAATLL